MRGILGEVLCGKSHLRPDWYRHLRADSLNCSPLYPLLLPQAESYIRLFAIYIMTSLFNFTLLKANGHTLLVILKPSKSFSQMLKIGSDEKY